MNMAAHLKSALPYGVVAALMISPWMIFPLVPGAFVYDNQRLVEILVVAMAGVTLLVAALADLPIQSILSRSLTLLLAGFFVIGMASCVKSYSPHHAWFEWANFLLLLVLAWLIATEINLKGDILLDRILLLCGVACAAYLLLQTVAYIHALKTGAPVSITRLVAGYINPRNFNHIQTVALPLLGLLAARIHRPAHKAFWWIVTAWWWMLLFMSAGRGTLLGLMVAIVLVGSGLRSAAMPWIRAMLASCLAGFLACLLFYVAIPMLHGLEPLGLWSGVVERTKTNADSGRIQLWGRALEMIQLHPWLGTGPGHFAHFGTNLNLGASPHSWLLQIASEWGIPALVLAVGALVLVMYRLWEVRKMITAPRADTFTALLVTAWALIVDGLVSGNILFSVSQLWIATYLGCAWGWIHSLMPDQKLTRCRRHPRTRIALSLAASFVTATLLASIWPEVRQIKLTHELKPKEYFYQPRILSDGAF
jgi:putative inorganic carbon (hco3(-)) transporter